MKVNVQLKREIEERKQTEGALQESEERYRNLVETEYLSKPVENLDMKKAIDSALHKHKEDLGE